MDEAIQETAKREVFEETGLQLNQLDLFGIYSGPNYDKTFSNGDQVSQVQIIFTCRHFEGNLVRQNEESIHNQFFRIDELPHHLFSNHKVFFEDLLSNYPQPFIK